MDLTVFVDAVLTFFKAASPAWYLAFTDTNNLFVHKLIKFFIGICFIGLFYSISKKPLDDETFSHLLKESLKAQSEIGQIRSRSVRSYSNSRSINEPLMAEPSEVWSDSELSALSRQVSFFSSFQRYIMDAQLKQ